MKKILVIEDNDHNYLLIEEYLSGYDIKLTRASNGVEFYSIINSNNNFDLILMDMMLPDTNGIILTKSLLQSDFSSPIIFFSANTDKRNEVFSLGIKCFISKPALEHTFISSICKHVELEPLECV